METTLPLQINIKAGASFSVEEWRQVDEVSGAAYADDTSELAWSDAQDWVVTGSLDGQVVSCLIIIERSGTVNGQPVRLGGIGGVATHPNAQRKGYARQIMLAAADFMRNQLKVEFGLLVCSPELTGYYARMGWQVVSGPLFADQPGGKARLDLTVMVLPCGEQKWPGGSIDLCGLPW